MFRTMTPRHIVTDVAIALVCGGLEVFLGVNGFHFSPVALVGMVTALALRRWSPGLGLSVAWLTALVQVFAGIGADLSNLAILAVLYTSASYGSRLVKWAGLASAGAGALVIAAFYSAQSLYWSTATSAIPGVSVSVASAAIYFFAALTAFVLSWTLGLLAKTWRRARANSLARTLAERGRIDAQQSVVVEQERNRIARDMHDVVAHSLAVVIAQADGARYTASKDGAAVNEALTTIAATAREALGDVRILLSQLRHSQGDAPQPVLADLDRLFEQFRTAGLSVRFAESGQARRMPTGTQLAVYRIVQEALTNALRHGDASKEAVVDFEWSAGELTLVVRNTVPNDGADISHAGPGAQGHGLAGMGERAALAGGSLEAEVVDREFVVTAIIPVAASEVPA
jgi:signal transduction histidine kinase